jgi:hypothetical protein
VVLFFPRNEQTMKQDQAPVSGMEKDAGRLETVENAVMEDGKAIAVERTDYAGAALKSDPAEIKLVRKLDYRIMVSCCASPRFGSCR